ncbi:AraC family ligand binding domain-containing protein [Lachnospiraceae bacterium 62-35]
MKIISPHASDGDDIVTVLEGTGRFTAGGQVFTLNEGETLIMLRGIPCSPYGEEQFKIQLTVSF